MASSLVMPLMAAEAVLVTSGKACVRTSSRSGSVFLAMAFAMFLSVCATRKIGLPVAAEMPAEISRLFLSDAQAFSCSMASWVSLCFCLWPAARAYSHRLDSIKLIFMTPCSSKYSTASRSANIPCSVS